MFTHLIQSVVPTLLNAAAEHAILTFCESQILLERKRLVKSLEADLRGSGTNTLSELLREITLGC
jgi:hypothetical protein